MNKKIVIFDFDGTLVDTKGLIVEALNQLAVPFDFERLDPDDICKLRNTRSFDFLKVIGVPLWKGPFLIRRIQKMISGNIKDLTLVHGLAEVLNALKDNGYRLAVVTSESEQNVKLFFEKYRGKCFDEQVSDIFVFGKRFAIKRLIKRYGILPEDAYYVGDETRDIVAAKKAGVSAIAVTWGFNTEHILEITGPDCIVHEPHDILSFILHGECPSYAQKNRLSTLPQSKETIQ